MNPELKFLVYHSPEDSSSIDVLVRDETVWASQKVLTELFDVSKSTISRHISNVFDEHELDESSTVAKIATVQNEGGRSIERNVTYYNLDVIISVGYRVNSQKATHFRQWATSVLREYMIKGFAMDDERLKQGERLFNRDYFQELIERVRSIRASERRIWQKVTDIFAEISTDYDSNSQLTKEFYATVQNKFHYAITGQTAAEIIYTHADQAKKNMGLTSWKNAPDGRILKSDTGISKNYLSEQEIRSLERDVSSYFDYVERLLERRQPLTMAGFADSIDRFLSFQEYKILDGRGTISMKSAKEKAGLEYEAFNKTQVINSDFDKQIQQILDSE